jgi:phage/plasmid-like protein (TIGR03299 family)
MAHNIHFNQTTGKHSFFSVQQKAWHGLGQMLNDHPSSSEAIQQAGLDYTVEKWPLYAGSDPVRISTTGSIFENQLIKVPHYFACVRTDNSAPLGVVGKDYQIVQNQDAFTFFDTIAQAEGIRYETAGALGAGERIFITAKMPGHIRVGKDDLIERYIILTNSHDGSGSITAAFTPVRIVCQNTLNAALGNKTSVVRIRHTSGAKQRLAQAHSIMGLASRSSEEAQAVFNRWAKVRISDPELKKLIAMAMAPNQEVLGNLRDGSAELLSSQFLNTIEDVYAYALSSPSQNLETVAGTVFGAYNAVTGYYQNVRS